MNPSIQRIVAILMAASAMCGCNSATDLKVSIISQEKNSSGIDVKVAVLNQSQGDIAVCTDNGYRGMESYSLVHDGGGLVIFYDNIDIEPDCSVDPPMFATFKTIHPNEKLEYEFRIGESFSYAEFPCSRLASPPPGAIELQSVKKAFVQFGYYRKMPATRILCEKISPDLWRLHPGWAASHKSLHQRVRLSM